MESSGLGPRQHENGEILQQRGKRKKQSGGRRRRGRGRSREGDWCGGGDREARGISGRGRSRFLWSGYSGGPGWSRWTVDGVARSSCFFCGGRWSLVRGSSPSHYSLGFVSSAPWLVFLAGDRGGRSAGVEWSARESEGSTRMTGGARDGWARARRGDTEATAAYGRRAGIHVLRRTVASRYSTYRRNHHCRLHRGIDVLTKARWLCCCIVR